MRDGKKANILLERVLGNGVARAGLDIPLRVPAFPAVAPGVNFFKFLVSGARGGLCICVPSIRIFAVSIPIGCWSESYPMNVGK